MLLTSLLVILTLSVGYPSCSATRVVFHSIQTNLSNLLSHVNASPFSFVAVFDVMFPGPRFSEYQEFAKHSTASKDLSVFHMLHSTAVAPEDNVFHKFNLTYIELPYYMLFRRGYHTPVTYRGSWKSDDILLWVSSMTGLRLSLPGCVAPLDALAHQARTLSVDEIRNRLLPEFRRIGSLPHYATSDTAKFYLVVVENLLRLGPSYLHTESVRLRRLVDSEVSDGQKNKLKQRLNILTQFMPPKEEHFQRKTEL